MRPFDIIMICCGIYIIANRLLTRIEGSFWWKLGNKVIPFFIGCFCIVYALLKSGIIMIVR